MSISKLRADADLRLGEVVARQDSVVEVLSNDGGPGVVESFPAPWAVQRWMEMIEQRHDTCPQLQKKDTDPPGKFYRLAGRTPTGSPPRHLA
jgi:hypothetical protein